MHQNTPGFPSRRLRLILLTQPVAQSQLAQANWMRQVDIQLCVRARLSVRAVPAGTGRVGLGNRRLPEAGPLRLEDARAGADDVDAGEGGGGARPERVELRPGGHVRLVEDGRGPLAVVPGDVRVLAQQLLGAGPQADVPDGHGAAALEEQLGEGEVDARAGACDQRVLARDGEGHSR